MSSVERIIVKHTRLALEIAELRHRRSIAETEEEATILAKRIDKLLQTIEYLREEEKLITI